MIGMRKLLVDKKVKECNRARCKQCNDIIESKHTHDYMTCKCGIIWTVDGGPDYRRRVFPAHPKDDWMEEMS